MSSGAQDDVIDKSESGKSMVDKSLDKSVQRGVDLKVTRFGKSY